jgi:thymidylate synthase (FAD)
MTVKLISITQGFGELAGKSPQDIISYTARVSSPNNQSNFDTAPKLLAYLIKHKHWSPFEMCHMTLEILTSRFVAQQILRHRSFSFQEFSQRYSNVSDSNIVIYNARRQDKGNRQNSIDDLPEGVKEEWNKKQEDNWKRSFEDYEWALKNNIAKECARTVLPLGTQSRLYMSGSVRSWIHYLESRTAESTQLEHREVALECQKIFNKEFPDMAQALGWTAEAFLEKNK